MPTEPVTPTSTSLLVAVTSIASSVEYVNGDSVVPTLETAELVVVAA